MSDERYKPNYNFEPGELMSWQEMTALLRELKERCLEQLTILSAEISDIKTRLDDLEEAVGELQVEYDGVGAITGFTPEQEYIVEARKFESQTGHLPETCLHDALDAHRTIDQWLI